jgi:streptogramin lyase
VVRARNGEFWSGSMVTGQVDRLDPATGAITEYLLPRHTNIRRVFLDNSVGRQQSQRFRRQGRAVGLNATATPDRVVVIPSLRKGSLR